MVNEPVSSSNFTGRPSILPSTNPVFDCMVSAEFNANTQGWAEACATNAAKIPMVVPTRFRRKSPILIQNRTLIGTTPLYAAACNEDTRALVTEARTTPVERYGGFCRINCAPYHCDLMSVRLNNVPKRGVGRFRKGGVIVVASFVANFRIALVAGMFCVGSAAAIAQTGPSNYTTYNFSPTSITWITCGSTSTSEGCYGSGEINGFGKICAVLQDTAKASDKSRNDLYVLDSDYKHQGTVALHVIRKTVTTANGFITTKFARLQTIDLPLQGGHNVGCQAAANASVVIVATNASTTAVEINKGTFSAGSVGGFSPPSTVTSIVADAAGYITVNFGEGFYLFGPDGSGVEDGGGSAYLIPGDNAYIP